MTRPLHIAVTTIASLTSACHMGMDHMGMDHMGNGRPPEVLEVDASEGRFEPTAAPDLDPAPDVVEVALEAKISDIELAPGRVVPMWT